MKKKFSLIKKIFTKNNSVFINPFKYINNQHHINKITSISKLSN